MQTALFHTAQVTRAAIANKTGDGDRVLSTLEKVTELGATTKSPAVLDACQRYFAAFKGYVPSHLPQTKTQEDLDKIVANSKLMKGRTLEKEPEMTGLRKIFRDAVIDFQSGKRPEQKPPAPPSNNNKKPDAPKAA
jgi:hypothetical protein